MPSPEVQANSSRSSSAGGGEGGACVPLNGDVPNGDNRSGCRGKPAACASVPLLSGRVSSYGSSSVVEDRACDNGWMLCRRWPRQKRRCLWVTLQRVWPTTDSWIRALRDGKDVAGWSDDPLPPLSLNHQNSNETPRSPCHRISSFSSSLASS
jgi:hypothetical protein